MIRREKIKPGDETKRIKGEREEKQTKSKNIFAWKKEGKKKNELEEKTKKFFERTRGRTKKKGMKLER